MPFPLRDIRKKSSKHVRACVEGDGAICSKNRKIVPYHGANPNTRNGARLRSSSLIMAPGHDTYNPVIFLVFKNNSGASFSRMFLRKSR